MTSSICFGCQLLLWLLTWVIVSLYNRVPPAAMRRRQRSAEDRLGIVAQPIQTVPFRDDIV